MKKLNKLTVLTIFTLSISAVSMPISQAAYPKAGASCTKLNSISTYAGKQYKCVKSGSKLIWALKVAIKPSTGTTSTTTTTPATPAAVKYYIPPVPTSSNPITFSNITSRVKDIPRAVFDSLQETKTKNADLPGAKVEITIIRSPHVTDANYKDVEFWISEEKKSFAHFANFKRGYVFVYPFEDVAWMEAKMDEILNDASFKAARPYDGQSCAETNRTDAPMVANITNGWDTPRDKSKPLELKIPFVLAGYCGTSVVEQWGEKSGTTHELSHQYQVVQYWNPITNVYSNSANVEPCWMTEGQATALGGYSYETDFNQYIADLKNLPRPYYLSSSMESTWKRAPLYWSPEDVLKYLKESSTNLPGCAATDRFALSYSLGSITVMALTAIGGWESTFALAPMLNDGISLNDAFKRVYGITWDEALPTLAQVVSELEMLQLDPPGFATYQVKDSTNIVTLTGEEGCAGYDPNDLQTTRARIQVLENGNWLDVPAIEQTWALSTSCTGLGAKSYLTTIKVAMDHGASYRFIYIGTEINIGRHDEYGRGFSGTRILS